MGGIDIIESIHTLNFALATSRSANEAPSKLAVVLIQPQLYFNDKHEDWLPLSC